MPIFIVETVATSPIREYWKVEAATAEDAASIYGEKGACLYDEVLGEEEDRQVSEVHPYGALASFFAAEAARKEAPAMLAALREVVSRAQDLQGGNPNAAEDLAAWADDAREILARIDGTDESTCSSCGAPEGESHAATCEARAFSAGVRARIDGEGAAPTARPAGVWRIVSGEPDTARTLYWSNANGWGGIAGSDAYGDAERARLSLPIGGAWWFDADEYGDA